MKVDALISGDLDDAIAAARRAELLGFDGVVSAEVAHDPFLPLTLASAATERVRLQTGIAVAFARNPMTVAVVASDLQRFSHGRFTLGLGSQIRAHVTRRFSMPWSHPAARMAEFVMALRSIWDAWETGHALSFEGEFYQHTLMTPMFSHGAAPYGSPLVFVAGVGPAMTAAAGEVADGYLAHGFTTPDYFRAVTLPQLKMGLERRGSSRGAFETSVPILLQVAANEEAIGSGQESLRQTIAFYGSTPAYRPVLAHHGFGELGDELHRLSKQGAWTQMSASIPDEVVDLMGVNGRSADVGAEIVRRFGGIADRIQVVVPDDDNDAQALLEAIRGNSPSRSTVDS